MTGSGTAADPFVIWDVNDLQNVNLDVIAYYELGQNIDASATIGWNAGKGFIPVGRATEYHYPVPTADHSSAGAWVINPADGILWDKILTNDGDATYIQATASPSWALFTVTPAIPPIIGSTINYVMISITRKKLGAAATSIQGYLRIGGVNYLIGAPQDSTNGMYSGASWYAYTNPATGLPWTVAEVNSIEAFGVYVGDATPNVRITYVYLRVRQEASFKGHFDGKGHTVDALFINRATEDSIGLFGNTYGATIQNISLTNVNMTGEYDVGALAGTSEGNTLIDNCSSTGMVTGAADGYDIAGLVGDHYPGSIIQNSHSSCHVICNGGDPSDIGGLVGDNRGDIANSYATGIVDVSGDRPYDIGGLAGDQGPGTISNSYATGDINITANIDLYDCGGLVGDNTGTIIRSYATGNLNITLSVPNGYDFGGLTGDTSGLIEQSFSTGTVTVRVTGPGAGAGVYYVGGFTGDNSGNITNSYSRSDVEVDNVFGGVWNQMVGGFSGRNTNVVENCYWAGILTVSGVFASVGGFVGADTGTTTNCFWDIETSGQATSAGGTGKTTEEMNHIALYLAAGWDFNSVWNISKVSTKVPTGTTPSSVLLNGLLDLTIINDAYPFLQWQSVIELPCDCGFEWGETLALGNFTPVDSKNTGEGFAQALSGLTPQTKYYFRARASSSPGPIHGGIGTFTTAVGIEVETLPATNITENSARIWGVVRKVPITAMGRFDWGGNIDYGYQTAWQPGLVSDDMFYVDLTNLAEGRAYHFRAVAMGSSLVYGNDMTFTTLSPLGPVTFIQEELAHIMEVA